MPPRTATASKATPVKAPAKAPSTVATAPVAETPAVETVEPVQAAQPTAEELAALGLEATVWVNPAPTGAVGRKVTLSPFIPQIKLSAKYSDPETGHGKALILKDFQLDGSNLEEWAKSLTKIKSLLAKAGMQLPVEDGGPRTVRIQCDDITPAGVVNITYKAVPKVTHKDAKAKETAPGPDPVAA